MSKPGSRKRLGKAGGQKPLLPFDPPEFEGGSWLDELKHTEMVVRAKLIVSLERALEVEVRRIETYRVNRTKRTRTCAWRAWSSAQEALDKLNRLEHLSQRRKKAIEDGWIIFPTGISFWNVAKMVVAEMKTGFEARDALQDQGFGLEDIPVLKWPDLWLRKSPASADFAWRLEERAKDPSTSSMARVMLRKFAKKIRISVELE